MELINKVKGVVNDVFTHWSTPAKGKYIPYKEIVALSGGSMGVQFIIYCVGGMMLSVGNFLIGNVIGIQPGPLYAIYVIAILASFPLTALRANIIDNTRSKKGKYRPYIIYMGLPTSILAIAFVWMPYEKMSDIWKCIVVLAFNIAFQFFYMFFYDVYDNYINVLSPNTDERAGVAAVRQIVASLAPSVIGLFLPIVAKAITGKNTLADIRIYRYAYPPLVLVGMILSIVIYVNTHEKIVQAKTHVIQIKFVDAFRAVAKNKYFWIISLAGWLGFLEGSYGNILGWLYSYQHACSPGVYGLITTLNGNAALWGMLAAPFAIKKFGKKKVLIFTNILNIFFIAMLYPSITAAGPAIMIWLVLICMFMNGVVGAFAHVLTPSINGDIRDYQQYVTGERIDGMFAAVGLIGSVITLATSGVLPALYSNGGINSTTLEQLKPWLLENEFITNATSNNVYDVLYNLDIFEHTMGVLIGASVVGAIMNVIPYFFYDLTELKQRSIIKVLKIRAMFEDFGNGVLTDKSIVETIDIISESENLYQQETVVLSKDAIKAAKAGKDKAAVKAAKKAYAEAEQRNKDIQISKFVMEEFFRFQRVDGKAQLSAAQETFDSGIGSLVNVDRSVLERARALPKSNEKEKDYRKAEIQIAKDSLYAKKNILKYYPDGIVEFNMGIFEELFKRDDENAAAINALIARQKEAAEAKDKAAVAEMANEMKPLKIEQAAIKAAIKKATNDNAIYHRAAKPYIDAKKLLVQAENYKHFDNIAEMYDEAKLREEETERLKAEKIKKEKEEKAALAASSKAEKKAKKTEKKSDKDDKKSNK